jgi:hypothetical protein
MPHAVDGKAMPEGVGVNVLIYQLGILVHQLPDPLLRYREYWGLGRYRISVNVACSCAIISGSKGYFSAILGVLDVL